MKLIKVFLGDLLKKKTLETCKFGQVNKAFVV